MTLFIINLSAAVELPEDKHICSSKGRLSEGRVSQSMVLRPALSASPELNGNANAWDPSQTYCCSVMSYSATPWTAACQASLAFTVSWSLLRFISTESVMLLNMKFRWVGPVIF